MLRLASSTISGGLFGTLTPIVALILLEPTDYGLFSLVYLVHAFGLSLQYSLVSEAWMRTGQRLKVVSPWPDFSTSIVQLSGLLALATLCFTFSIPPLRTVWWLFAAAVFFAIYRSGTRYYSISTGSTLRALMSDLSGVVAFLVTIVLLSSASDLVQVTGSWLAAGVASAAVLRLPSLRWGSGLFTWVRRHWSAIKPLLADSLLMDAGAIGTPFLLAGLMGATNFGIYRAVSNVSMPVRVLVEPLRPIIGRLSRTQLFSLRVSAPLAISTLFLSLASYLVLILVVPLFGTTLGTLSALVEFALPSAIYVAGSVLTYVYFLACRANASARGIMTGRITQSILVIALPVVGFFSLDLAGAIWGFAISSALTAIVWLRIAQSSHSRLDPRQQSRD